MTDRAAAPTNDYLDHYRANKISPVRQDISDYRQHARRRLGLYRSLGLLPCCFQGKRVLEVGPGSGYNSLVVTELAPARYVLVEPNATGVQHIEELFRGHRVDMSAIELCNVVIEDFRVPHRFDVVLCEGMIPGLKNKREVLSKLMDLVEPGGLLAVTCADEISMFYEIIRIYVAHKLTSQLAVFQEKIKVSVEAFASHLQTVHGFSRLLEDWCADCLFGEAHFNYDLSVKGCIEIFQESAFYYNSSPDLFTDLRWYKASPTDPAQYNRHFIEQFDASKHNLMLHTQVLPAREVSRNNELHALCQEVMSSIHRLVYQQDPRAENEFLTACLLIEKNLADTAPAFRAPMADIVQIIKEGTPSVEDIGKRYQNFRSAFGRGQQYISLLKA